jgi:hypothetical protein
VICISSIGSQKLVLYVSVYDNIDHPIKDRKYHLLDYENVYIYKRHNLKHHHEYRDTLKGQSAEDLPTETTNNNDHPNEAENDWTIALKMFSIFSLENLFWVLPFAAHDLSHSSLFAVTYQLLVLAILFQVTFEQPGLMSTARNMNLLWGICGAIFCWAMSFYFYVQYKKQQSLQHSTISSQKNRQQQSSRDQMELPLLESNSDAKAMMWDPLPATVPTIWLTILMTVLGAMDDIFIVPFLVKKQALTNSQVLMGSSMAVTFWTLIAAAIARYYRRGLSQIPTLYGHYNLRCCHDRT